ncbi:MAG: GumC family protein [Blastocatellia bacterium]
MGSFRPRNLADFLQILWRRRLLVFFVALVVLLSALAVIISMPRVYESRALILVSGQIYDRQANGAQIAAVTEQTTSRANLEALIQRYDLGGDAANTDLAIQNLQSGIKLEPKFRSDNTGFPESFTVTFRHNDPAIAQKVAADLVSVFDKANATLEKQAADEMRAIRDEIADIESQLSRANQQRAAGEARGRWAGSRAASADRIRSERNAISSSVEALKDRQFALQQQVADQKRLILQQQDIVRNAPVADDSRMAGSYGALLKRKAELEAQVQEYSSKFTDKYPKLSQAREQLAEVNQRIAQASPGEQTRAIAATPAAQELRNLQRDLTRMETELAVVERELNRKLQAAAMIPGGISSTPLPPMPAAPAAGPVSADGDYRYESLRDRYGALLKREAALRELQPSPSGPGAPFFQVVNRPNLPQSPAAPKRARLAGMALGLALAAGLAAAFVAEAPKLSMIVDDRDVKYYLGVPVVALIPETLTVAERGHTQRDLFKRRLRLLMLGAAALPLLVLLFNSLNIFQILGSK